MTALHIWLLAVGGGLALGPLILHLLLQEKPKRMLFPALRFVLAREQHARRSYRLRHWVLLALRIAMIALAAFALSRPAAATALFGSSILLGVTLISGVLFLFLALYWRNKVKSQPDRGLTGGSAPNNALRDGDPSRKPGHSGRAAAWPVWLLLLVVAGHVATAIWLAMQLLQSGAGPVLSGKQPVAAAIVVDTSPRMLYRKDNQTRLERAKELAAIIVKMLPAGSQLTVVDSSPDPVGLSLDISAAQQQVEALQISYQSLPMPTRMQAALQLLEDSPLEGRELYVISDLSRPSWTQDNTRRRRIDKDENVSLYVIDVGAKSHENWSIDEWNLPTPSITPGGLFQVRATVSRKAIMGSEENLVREVEASRTRRIAQQSTAPNPENGEAVAVDQPDLLLTEPSGGQMAQDLPAESRTIRLMIERPETGRPVYRNGETLLPTNHWERITQVTLAPGQSREVAFSVPELSEGIHHGWIEIDGGDALGFDNRRYFTVAVQPAWKVLVVNGPGVSDANLLEAIAPQGIRERGQAEFDSQVIQASQLKDFNLNDFRAVYFLNPSPLEGEHWNQLYRYVSNGGSVGLFLGHNGLTTEGNRSIPHPSFNGELAQRLLPGRLEDPWRRPDGKLFFDPSAWDHPIFARMQPIRTTLPWDSLPVFMHYAVQLDAASPARTDAETTTPAPAPPEGETAENGVPTADEPTDQPPRDADRSDRPLPKTVRVLATYSNNMPALIETTVGQGQVLTMTTPITDPTRPDDGRRPWNSFSISGNISLPYYILMIDLARYLATAKSANLNGMVGDRFVLPNDQANAPTQYALYRPDNQEPMEVAVERSRMYLDFNDRPGAYRLRGTNKEQEIFLRGFTVNVPGTQSDLTRIGKPQLDSWLGPGQYAVAENEEQIERVQGAGRIGLEFYPSLIRLLALAFLAEILFSNWFYKEPPKKKTAHEIVTGVTE